MSDNKQPNWDKITEGKIRHGFAVEAFSKDRKLDGDLMKEIDRWVYFVVHGYHDLKEVLKDTNCMLVISVHSTEERYKKLLESIGEDNE